MYKAGVWTTERVELLTKLWKEGDSATQIAGALSTIDMRFSRNAVIGKAHRLGLTAREERKNPIVTSKVVAARSLSRTPRQPKAKPDPVKVAEVIAIIEKPAPERFEDVYRPKPLNLSLLELEWNDCRYAVGGEKEHTLFCGHTTDRDSSYCTYHHKLCHGPGTKSERLVDHLIRKVA